MDEKKAYAIANQRVMAKMSLLIHLAIYVVVNSALIYINLETSSEYLWYKWPLLGWGVGLFFHALGVLFFSGASDFKRQMLEKEAKKLLETK